MCQIKTPSENPPSAPVADRLLERVAQGNPLVALGAALVLPLVRLFAGRKPAQAAIRKQKLQVENYSYSPLVSARSGYEASPKDPRTILEGSSDVRGAVPAGGRRRPPASGSGQKGGCRHGHH